MSPTIELHKDVCGLIVCQPASVFNFNPVLALIISCDPVAFCLQADFRDYPPLLRQAVSIARKIQDPLVEYAQVCSTDEDILCLKLHPLQVSE